ncbi:MAG: ribosome maturation factor RimP [Actinomycetota bacterium]|jgi:ribosome maturation factor RimP
MSDNSTLERVRSLVTPIVTDLTLDLYDLEFRGGTLRVTIDTHPGSPGGVDLEQIALATRLISRELDHHDPVPGRYTLEVTSPGLERSLRTAAHFQREIGKTVNVRLRGAGGDARRVQGVLVSADEHQIGVRPEPTKADPAPEVRIVALDSIDRARTVFVWGPAPKPGSGGGKARRAAAGGEVAGDAGDLADELGDPADDHDDHDDLEDDDESLDGWEE